MIIFHLLPTSYFINWFPLLSSLPLTRVIICARAIKENPLNPLSAAKKMSAGILMLHSTNEEGRA